MSENIHKKFMEGIKAGVKSKKIKEATYSELGARLRKSPVQQQQYKAGNMTDIHLKTPWGTRYDVCDPYTSKIS